MSNDQQELRGRHPAVTGTLLVILLVLLLVAALITLYLTGPDMLISSGGAAPVSVTAQRPTIHTSATMTRAEGAELLLDLINEARANAGSPPVVMGTNRAAQIHANSALAGCFSSHWGLDGTKPYMRYTLAGGYQAVVENFAGPGVCTSPGQGFAPHRGAGTRSARR